MANYYWNENSWGADYPPENWSDIVDAANSMIDAFIKTEHLAPELDEDDIKDYSEKLWERYCGGEEFQI